MSSSSSDEEINDALKESANCDYITKLITSKENVKKAEHSQKTKNVPDEDVKKNDHFEQFLAQRLAERLDKNIELVTKTPSIEDGEDIEGGISLFSNAPILSKIDEPTIIPQKRPKLDKSTAINYEKRSKKVAVTSDWVTSTDNTKHWKDNKKQRILTLTKVKRSEDGTIEGTPLH